ncbi:MAG TPA: cell filamentation protein Fic [Candidatus Portnoybacteria bacterium]|nr:cell filamentation protein Fic [Candidatus Portnoybacteria bacterium]
MSFKIQKINKRQEIILDYVSGNVKVSVSEILNYLRGNFEKVSRITVIRDLDFLIKQKFLIRQGFGRAVKYQLSLQYNLVRTIDLKKYFAISQDRRQIKERFDFGIFQILKNDIFTAQEKEWLLAWHQKFQQRFKQIKSKTLIKKEFERIIIEFSWKSSQIEGNTYSLLDTETLIKKNRIAQGKTKEEAQMILNNKRAFDFVLDNITRFKTLSRAKIEQIHRILTYKLDITKNLRHAPVRIIGTNYQPIDNVFQIEEAVKKMCQLINSKENFFEKSFLSLILLSYIQPFEDGNKRTARMIANAILLAHRSIPISYRAVDETEYKKASVLFYEINNLSYFKQIFIEQFKFATENYFLL